jgi:tRNA G18 (ribose-2'-O)-methylase SpoU
MREKIRTIPNLADTSPAHQAAIAAGDDHFRAWQYNVADRFKGSTVEDIRQNLKETANPFAVCVEHLINDFNLGTVIRNANAFNAKEAFYLGDKKWDKRSAVGVYNYTDVKWLPTIDDFIKLKKQYTIVGIDNVAGSVSINEYNWEPNSLLVFGEEGVGLTPTIQSHCDAIVEIPMYGSVRSLNCGVASGIVMHDFVSQINRIVGAACDHCSHGKHSGACPAESYNGYSCRCRG